MTYMKVSSHLIQVNRESLDKILNKTRYQTNQIPDMHLCKYTAKSLKTLFYLNSTLLGSHSKTLAEKGSPLKE